jgi:valyl-tRNA synthetase
LHRLFAPFLPFVTEEIWSWWQTGSIHIATWPKVNELTAFASNPKLLTNVSEVLMEIRKAKTNAQQSMRAEVSNVKVSANDETLQNLAAAKSDLFAAGRIQNLETSKASELTVEVTLA